jgi:hypothetical protein
MYGTRILLIGDDDDALLCRAEVISSAGHEVEIAIGRDRGILACAARFFDYIFVTARNDDAALALVRDIETVSPASEVVNVNQWRAAGLQAEHEPGFLLSLLTAAVQPIAAAQDHSTMRAAGKRRSAR